MSRISRAREARSTGESLVALGVHKSMVAVVLLAVALVAAGVRGEDDASPPKNAAPAQNAAAGSAGQPSTDARYTTEKLRGRVLWQGEALKRRFDIEVDADAAELQAVLDADDGKLYPLLKDARGRAFWLDERIRNRDVELTVRRYRDAGVVQVIRICTLHDGKRFELDYWCDICAIPMYELKACECCQGEIRLRERLIEESDRVGDELPQAAQP